MLIPATFCLFSYLLGSIPSAVWYGTTYLGKDIRQYGSGNAGATNTFRVLGWHAGIIVLFIDILKGWLASELAYILLQTTVIASSEILHYKLAFGILAIVGHLYPIFANFRGGKGVATLFGMVVSLHPIAALVCIGIFLLVFSIFHYVSVASMIATISFPLLFACNIFSQKSSSLLYFGITMSLLVLYTHRNNITKLLQGKENQIFLRKK